MAFFRFLLRASLTPLSFLLAGVVYARGFLYDRGVLRAYASRLPTIGIGNLAVGGAGKSPMALYLVGMLAQDFCPVVLSRGYGRRTRGFREVNMNSPAEEVGDEPLQLKRRYPNVPVLVCEDRVEGCRQIAERFPEANVVVLDDAYQHRRLRVGLEFLLTAYSLPFHRDFYLPVGRLRDARGQSKRAKCVVVTKCPEALASEERQKLEGKLLSGNQLLACSALRYGRPRGLWDDGWRGYGGADVVARGSRVVVLSAIANALPFVEYVKTQWDLVGELHLRDHSRFRPKHLEWMEQAVADGALVVTTEKDAMRLRDVVPAGSRLGSRIAYIPIEVAWLGEDESKVRRLVYGYLGEN